LRGRARALETAHGLEFARFAQELAAMNTRAREQLLL